MSDTPDKMVIAYLTSMYARASDTYFRSEVREMRLLGHTVHTFSIRKPPANQIISDEIRSEYNNTVYLLPDHRVGVVMALLTTLLTRPAAMLRTLRLSFAIGAPGLRNRLWQIFYAAEAAFLARALLQRGVQHLHHHLEEGSANVAMLTSELSGIPWSMQVHGPYIFYRPHEWALGRKVAHATFTSCISHFAVSQCMVFAPYAAWKKLKIVRVCPDRRFVEKTAAPVPADRRLVWIGRICEEKAVPTLIEAAGRLAAENVDFELVMVGDGPLRGEMETLVRTLGLTGRVRFAGWLSGEAVKQEILRSRALVMPSFAEGLPTVIMEAFALGRPAISTTIAGVMELVEHGRNGWLVPPADVAALAESMKHALDASPQTLQQMGEAASADVRRKHDSVTEAKKLESYIRDSIAANAKKTTMAR